MRNAYDLYDHLQDKDFDLYEHLGNVHPPPSAKVRKGKRVAQKSDASAESGHTYSSAKDVLEQLGLDPNTVIHIPENDDETHDGRSSTVYDALSAGRHAFPA
ncbi:MAG: hypothetical protein ACKPKO_27515, partial [Candidatus Fonsibacter sp.]